MIHPEQEARLRLNLQKAGLSKIEAAYLAGIVKIASPTAMIPKGYLAFSERCTELERQLAELLDGVVVLESEKIDLQQQLANAQKDSQRLDWYMMNSEWKLYRETQGRWSCMNAIRQLFTPAFPHYRDAIDAAMAGADEEDENAKQESR